MEGLTYYGIISFLRRRIALSPALTVWRKPFKYAIRVLAFSAIWLLVGMVFMFGGMVVLAAGIRGGSPSLVVAIILFAVGYLIIYLGILMALFRYLPEALAEKVKGY